MRLTPFTHQDKPDLDVFINNSNIEMKKVAHGRDFRLVVVLNL